MHQLKTMFSQRSLDTIGFWASAGCSIHCLALPILLSLSAFSHFAFLNRPYVETSMITLSVFIGLGSMVPSYFRYHRKFSALYLLTVGFSLIAMSRIVDNEVWEIILTSVGAALVAVAHISNHRLCKQAGSTITRHS